MTVHVSLLFVDVKANEIAFINTLEAQNKRLDILSKHQESEARLADMQVRLLPSNRLLDKRVGSLSTIYSSHIKGLIITI